MRVCYFDQLLAGHSYYLIEGFLLLLSNGFVECIRNNLTLVKYVVLAGRKLLYQVQELRRWLMFCELSGEEDVNNRE